MSNRLTDAEILREMARALSRGKWGPPDPLSRKGARIEALQRAANLLDPTGAEVTNAQREVERLRERLGDERGIRAERKRGAVSATLRHVADVIAPEGSALVLPASAVRRALLSFS